MFDINRKIVWKGHEFIDAYADYQPSTKKAVVSYYNPVKYEITPKQLRVFNNHYLPSVAKEADKNWAFAISTDGKTVLNSSRGRGSYREVAQMVMTSCIAKSSSGKCFVYAVNNEQKTEN